MLCLILSEHSFIYSQSVSHPDSRWSISEQCSTMEVQELLYTVLTNMPLMPDDNKKLAGNVSETKLFLIGEKTFYCFEKSQAEQKDWPWYL